MWFTMYIRTASYLYPLNTEDAELKVAHDSNKLTDVEFLGIVEVHKAKIPLLVGSEVNVIDFHLCN